MKKIMLLMILSVFFSHLFSCKKTEVKSSSIVSLNVTTAVISGGNVKLNTNTRDSAKVYNAKSFGVNPGNTPVLAYPTNDPATLYFNSSINSSNGEMYSLFLCGQSPNFESVLVKEHFPPMYGDSSIGVRVINLSPNSNPINVTLQNNTGVNLFSTISYKTLTDFVKIPLPGIIPAGSVSFQVRSAANPSSVLATYTLPASVNSTYPGISVNLQRFKNITLVVKGLQGATSGADAFGVFPVTTTY